MEVLRSMFVAGFCASIVVAAWFPAIQPQARIQQPIEMLPDEPVLVALAKQVDDVYGEHTARMVCQHALFSQLAQAPKTSSTSSPELAARSGFGEIPSMLPTLNQLQTLSTIGNFINQGRQVMQRVMSVIGYG